MIKLKGIARLLKNSTTLEYFEQTFPIESEFIEGIPSDSVDFRQI